jgi:hypothetical protein
MVFRVESISFQSGMFVLLGRMKKCGNHGPGVSTKPFSGPWTERLGQRVSFFLRGK